MNYHNFPAISPVQNLNTLTFDQGSLRIPPFPATSTAQLREGKRQNSYILDETICPQAGPVKKIRVDSFNMLYKPALMESDPCRNKNNYRERLAWKENQHPSVVCEKLNSKIIKQKGITINISKMPQNHFNSQQDSPMLFNNFQQNLNQQNSYPHNIFQNFYQGLDASKVLNSKHSKPLYDVICQKLEENCNTLWNQIQELVTISQNLKRETLSIPTFNNAFDDTLPGTPNTTNIENYSEIKSDAETFESIEKVPQNKKLSIQPIKQDMCVETTKSNKVLENSTNEIQKRTKNILGLKQKVGLMRTVYKNKKVDKKNIETKDCMEKSSNGIRKMNRLQVLKCERENLLSEVSSPYTISLHINQDSKEKVVKTRKGEDYQAIILPFGLCDEQARPKRELKLKHSLENNPIAVSGCVEEEQDGN